MEDYQQRRREQSTMNEIQTLSFGLMASAIKRPEMYTPNGTAGEVLSFLEGYYSAVAESTRSADRYEAGNHS